jgi:hypothetical protein
MFKSSEGAETKDGCAGEVQQQFTDLDSSPIGNIASKNLYPKSKKIIFLNTQAS